MSETVKVMVRVRPMNTKEINEKAYLTANVDEKLNSIQLSKPDN